MRIPDEMNHMARLRHLPAALIVALAAGCGSNTATVTGEVTYDGQAVADGMITFLPADGKGQPAAAKIVQGQYKIENLAPGPKVVKIEAVKAVTFARSTEEMARMAAANRDKSDGSGLIEPADVIPSDARGNNATVDIKPGRQTHSVHLQKPEAGHFYHRGI
jgi:hypothetical protein